MRISTLNVERAGINSILDQQSKLSYTQQQVSSGKRIVTPSDDPADATRVLDLKKTQARTEQYQDNITLAENRLSREDATLTGITDALQRIRELAIQGLNDTQGSTNRVSIASEIRSRLDELLGLANSQDGNGEYLFAGYQTGTKPFNGDPFLATGATFTYVGDEGQRQSQISATRQLATNDPGSDVFMGVPDDTGAASDIFTLIYDFSVNMEANNPNATVLNHIDSALDNVTTTQAKVGSRLNVIDSQKSINEDHILTTKAAISDLEDLDYAEAVSRMNLQLTGLQAAQQAYSKVQGLSLFNYL
ncbi:flagellar hook-associated protein FlgL [Endothiovibrio diazotrophicus]